MVRHSIRIAKSADNEAHRRSYRHAGSSDLSEYRGLSAAGTVAKREHASCDVIHCLRNIAFRALRVCRTVPRLETGNLRFSYPKTLPGWRYRLPKFARRYALPQPRYRRLRFGCRSYRLSPPKDGAAWILSNPNHHGFALSRRPVRQVLCTVQFTCSVFRIYRRLSRNASTRTFPAIAQKKSRTTVRLTKVVFVLHACMRSPACSRRRRIARKWIWLTLPSVIPSRAPIRDMVNPSKWYQRITAR